VLAAACALAVLSTSMTANARLETTSPYTHAQTFNGALRYLRVDLGFEVVERDEKAGYLLFEYVAFEGQKPSRGAIEVIEVKQNVKVVVQLPAEPSHHESVLSKGLMKKLQNEYGDPPRKTKRDEEDENGDDDEDDSADGENEGAEAAPAPADKPRRRVKRRSRR
jgi:hypothetical protein